MNIFVAGLSYRTAPVAVREKLAVQPARLRCQGCRLKIAGGLSEVVVLSTCNRVEIYGAAPEAGISARQLARWFEQEGIDFSAYGYIQEGTQAAQHLFCVVSGLDSMVIGETEIAGQVKQAYLAAQEMKLTGRMLNRVFQTAFQTAKEIRTRTHIGRGATSVGSVAVELAGRIFDRDLSDKTVMIIGAGKMGEACVRHLNKQGARSVLVSNRTFDRAQALAAEFGGRAIQFEDCLAAMAEADIVVSSTGCPQVILNRADVARVMAARPGRALVLIDIAVPRDIAADVQQLDNVFLYDVDDLEGIVRENTKCREQELARCRSIIAGHAGEVVQRLTRRTVAEGGEARSAFGLFQPAACRV
jgi:glutamyl-tRNA reductase